MKVVVNFVLSLTHIIFSLVAFWQDLRVGIYSPELSSLMIGQARNLVDVLMEMIDAQLVEMVDSF